MSDEQKGYRSRPCRSTPGRSPPRDERPRRADLPDDVLRLRRHRARRAASSRSSEFGNIYTRIMNPTTDVFEKRIAALEGGVARARDLERPGRAVPGPLHDPRERATTSSRRATSTAAPTTSSPYSFPRLGDRRPFVDGDDPEGVRAGDRRRAPALLYVETIGNPQLQRAGHRGARRGRARRTASPWSSTTRSAPRALPARSSTAPTSSSHSATKWIGGHGTSIGGVIVDGGRFDWAQRHASRTSRSPPGYHGLASGRRSAPSPFGNIAFIIKARVEGLRDLGPCAVARSTRSSSCRGSRRCRCGSSATSTTRSRSRGGWSSTRASRGSTTPVSRPPLARARDEVPARSASAAVLTFGIKGGARPARPVHRRRAAGQPPGERRRREDARHPPRHDQPPAAVRAEQRAAGVTPEFVRVAVGLEHIEDIKADFEQALDRAVRAAA